MSSADRTDRVIVSTLMEAWEVVNAGLVADGTVKDVSPTSCVDLQGQRFTSDHRFISYSTACQLLSTRLPISLH